VQLFSFSELFLANSSTWTLVAGARLVAITGITAAGVVKIANGPELTRGLHFIAVVLRRLKKAKFSFAAISSPILLSSYVSIITCNHKTKSKFGENQKLSFCFLCKIGLNNYFLRLIHTFHIYAQENI